MPLTRVELSALIEPPLPLPGDGRTLDRWVSLSEIARADLATAKLVESHHDAVAIVADLAPETAPTGTWAVWASEPPFARVVASLDDRGWRLTGHKVFCSGARLVDHALISADDQSHSRLFAISLDDPGVTVAEHETPWVGPGMAGAGTVALHLDDVVAKPVGEPGAYVDRPGFWHGAIGVAACWWGGARAIADALEGADRLDAHGLAHRGAVRARLHAVSSVFSDAARAVDRDPDQAGERLAQAVRAVVADAVDTTIHHVGRATGPGPLAFDEAHAQRVADLQVYVRQHHAERDLARLGEMGSDA